MLDNDYCSSVMYCTDEVGRMIVSLTPTLVVGSNYVSQQSFHVRFGGLSNRLQLGIELCYWE